MTIIELKEGWQPPFWVQVTIIGVMTVVTVIEVIGISYMLWMIHRKDRS